MTNLHSVLKSRDITLLTKVRRFFWMWELGHKEGWAPKNWCFWIVLLEKTLESPLDYKEMKPVNPKGNQPWIFTGRTDAEAEAPILWPPDPEPTHWKRPWCWERLRAGEEEGDREWDGWMTSPTQWTWVWTNSGRWWRTRKLGLLQSMGCKEQTWLSDWTIIVSLDTFGEGNGNPLQYSCLENPMDGGAW